MNAVFIANIDNDFSVPKTGASVMLVKPRAKSTPKPVAQSVANARKRSVKRANGKIATQYDKRKTTIPPQIAKTANQTHSGQTVVLAKSPKSTTSTVTAPPEKSIAKSRKLTQEEIDLIDDLNSRNSGRVRSVARYIYLKKCESQVVVDQAAFVLASKYNRFTWDGLHVDAMAWICKALMVTENKKYLPLLAKVEKQAKSPKLRKYARRCGFELKKKAR
jgi:hypothetical protein